MIAQRLAHDRPLVAVRKADGTDCRKLQDVVAGVRPRGGGARRIQSGGSHMANAMESYVTATWKPLPDFGPMTGSCAQVLERISGRLVANWQAPRGSGCPRPRPTATPPRARADGR